MQTYIALLRGINVGGKNKLPMKDLISALEKGGLQNVATYIQSGNVVFQKENTAKTQISEQIEEILKSSFGIESSVVILTKEEWSAVIRANPYPEAEEDPKSLHFYFMHAPPDAPNLNKMNELKSDSERFEIIDSVLYLHAPDGIGRSKLAAKVEHLLGCPATARNWRTVSKLDELSGEN